MRRGAVSLACLVALLGLQVGPARAQTPPVRDTARVRPPDSTRVTTLDSVRSSVTRAERQQFDAAPNVGRITMSARDLAAVPRFFAEADLLRAIQLLPGVEARNDFSASLSVRGGESDQNLVLLDGYPIYNPFHLGGLFGTFLQPMVGRVDVLTGGFPAPYGGRLSSVVDVRSSEELRSGLHGTADVSLLASSASLGQGFAAGKGSWKLAARRTYIDRAISLLTPDELPYDFRDLQGHASYAFANGWRVGTTAYAGHDQLNVETAEGPEHFSWGNRVVGATVGRSLTAPRRRFGLSLGDSVVVEQRASYSTFAADVKLGQGVLSIENRVSDVRASGLAAVFSDTGRHTRTLGYEVARQRFSYTSNRAIVFLAPEAVQSETMTSAGLYFDDLWRVTPKLMIDAGGRFDAVNGTQWAQFSPRLSAKYFVTPDLAITAATGRYAQWVRTRAREEVPIRPLDFWVGSGRDWPVSTAWHYVLGAEGWVSGTRGFRVEAFSKTYRDLLEPNPIDDARETGDEFLFLRGHSYGADVMIRQLETHRFSGWLAYTFALNRRTSLDGTQFTPAQDRRHDINAVASWRFPKYTLSARYNLATGTPYTYVRGSFERYEYNPIRHVLDTDGTRLFLTGPRNGERLPTTHRLDVSLSRTGKAKGTTITPYLSVVNAVNAQNVFTYYFDYTAVPPTRTTFFQFPILPSLGLSVTW